MSFLLTSELNHMLEKIKQEYRRNNRIERFMNPAITVPIEQCYINLSIVETKEQRDKEKQLQKAQNTVSVISAYEDIYAAKTAIDIKDIFTKCKGQEKQVLVFGRAGIGKSTFCRYMAYQWAMGSYWQECELLALIPLRRLTVDYYPSGKNYSLVDLVKTELFSLDLTAEEEDELTKQFDPTKTLWILDGYDEIVHNIPPHLQRILEQLLKTPHHIITSRPYLNTLSYQVQMEIIGFTDENIHNYVCKFFEQIKDESDDHLSKSETLSTLLRSNASIWGVAHVPVNLELICSIWSSDQSLETERLTMTSLYTRMTQWLCRRYLTSQTAKHLTISTDKVNERCQKELIFLETLAFRAMENNSIFLGPDLLKKISKETKICSESNSEILNMDILKSVDKQGIDTAQPTDKDHYFIHLSFQEYFAARYLSKALQNSQDDEAVAFIRQHKYNRRYTLLFSFTAGLLNEDDIKSYFDLFWDTLLGIPMDLIGVRHLQIVIACMEQIHNKTMLQRHSSLLEWIFNCLTSAFLFHNNSVHNHLLQSLRAAQSIVSDVVFIKFLIDSLGEDDVCVKNAALRFIAQLDINDPTDALIKSVLANLNDTSERVRLSACDALGNIGVKTETKKVISQLMRALGDQSKDVRTSACYALGDIARKVATNEVINQLASGLRGQREDVRSSACLALGMIGVKTETKKVISQLMRALGDQSKDVRSSACLALGMIGEKAETNEVIKQLVAALEDQSEEVRSSACFALGEMGEKAETNEVINQLMNALGDQSEDVRNSACYALGEIGKKAVTDEVIRQLVSALGDQSEEVRSSACYALGEIGEKAATDEVISHLVSALGDQSEDVRSSACSALEKIGKKARTNEVIKQLMAALEDQSENVRSSACLALGMIGEKAETNEVISHLVSALGDQSEEVRSIACSALGEIGEKAATDEVIKQLVAALEDQSEEVRSSACYAAGKIGEKAATSEVIKQVASALGDQSEDVR